MLQRKKFLCFVLCSALTCGLLSFPAAAQQPVSLPADASQEELVEAYDAEFDQLEQSYIQQVKTNRSVSANEDEREGIRAITKTIQTDKNAVVTLSSIVEEVPVLQQTRGIGGLDDTDVYVCARIYIRTEYETKTENGRGYVRFYRGIGRVLNYYDGYSGNGVVVTYGNIGSGGGAYSSTYTLLSSQSYDFESYHDKWVYDYPSTKVGQSAMYKFRRSSSSSDTIVEVECHYTP